MNKVAVSSDFVTRSGIGVQRLYILFRDGNQLSREARRLVHKLKPLNGRVGVAGGGILLT